MPEMALDQFDEMLEQSRKYPLVFAVDSWSLRNEQPLRVGFAVLDEVGETHNIEARRSYQIF